MFTFRPLNQPVRVYKDYKTGGAWLSRYFLLIVYLDDFLYLAASTEECQTNIDETIGLLERG